MKSKNIIITFAFIICGFSYSQVKTGTFYEKKYCPKSKYQSYLKVKKLSKNKVFIDVQSSVIRQCELDNPTFAYFSDTLKVTNNKAMYILSDEDLKCKIEISFNNNIIKIKTLDNYHICGFGYGAYPDGKYILKSK